MIVEREIDLDVFRDLQVEFKRQRSNESLIFVTFLGLCDTNKVLALIRLIGVIFAIDTIDLTILLLGNTHAIWALIRISEAASNIT